jgi:hypothetical protein
VVVVVPILTPAALTLDPLEALERGVALDQRAVDGEVLVAGEPRVDRPTHDPVEELLRDPVARQTLAVVAEGRVVEDAVGGVQIQELP